MIGSLVASYIVIATNVEFIKIQLQLHARMTVKVILILFGAIMFHKNIFHTAR